MENLTKENFFNELQEQYPVGMKVFCDWIDKYKADNDWDSLFRNNYVSRNLKLFIKYHHLPFAMQIGIWIEFISSWPTVHEWEIDDLSNHDWKVDITNHIKLLNEDEGLRTAVILNSNFKKEVL